MANGITAERSLAALETQKLLRLGIEPTKEGSWLVTRAGNYVGSIPAATQVEAIEAAAAAIAAGERRTELQDLRDLAAALDRGRFYPRPKLSAEAPQIKTFDVVSRATRLVVTADLAGWLEAAHEVNRLDIEAAAAELAALPPAPI